MKKVVIQEGIHTISVYFPPDAVMLVLGRFAEGLTFIFDAGTINLDTVFSKDGEFNETEMEQLNKEAVNILQQYYQGTDDEYR